MCVLAGDIYGAGHCMSRVIRLLLRARRPLRYLKVSSFGLFEKKKKKKDGDEKHGFYIY